MRIARFILFLSLASVLLLVGWIPSAYSAPGDSDDSQGGRFRLRPVVGTALGYAKTQDENGSTVYQPALLGVMTLAAFGYKPAPWWYVFGAYGPTALEVDGSTSVVQVGALGVQYDDALMMATLFVGVRLGLSAVHYRSVPAYFVGLGLSFDGAEIDFGDLGTGPLLTASDVESDLSM